MNTNTPSTDRYYGRIGGLLRASKYITLIVMLIYLLLTIAVYRKELTVENFRYLIKYFDSSSTEQSGGLKNYRDIYFDATSEIMLGLYQSDLAVVKSDSVDIYNMLGNNTLSFPISYAKPVLLSDGKYMLTYALGEYSYTVNNAFSQLHSETLEYPISGAAMSDTGLYAIATRSLEYKGTVRVYDESFDPISVVSKDKYITDVDLTADADELLVTSVYNADGEFRSEVMTISPRSDKPRATISVDGSMAVRARYNGDGGYVVIFDDHIRFYDSSDSLEREKSFGGNVPTNYLIGDSYSAIVMSENAVGSRGNITIFDNHGREEFSTLLDGRIIDIEADEKYVYVLFEDSLSRIDPIAGKVESAPLESGCLSLVLKDHDVVLVCYTNRASAYDMDTLLHGRPEVEETTDVETTTTTETDGEQ